MKCRNHCFIFNVIFTLFLPFRRLLQVVAIVIFGFPASLRIQNEENLLLLVTKDSLGDNGTLLIMSRHVQLVMLGWLLVGIQTLIVQNSSASARVSMSLTMLLFTTELALELIRPNFTLSLLTHSFST